MSVEKAHAISIYLQWEFAQLINAWMNEFSRLPVKPLVRRLVNKWYTMKIAYSLNIRKNAGTNHECEHVHGYEECGTHGERYQHAQRHLCVVI